MNEAEKLVELIENLIEAKELYKQDSQMPSRHKQLVDTRADLREFIFHNLINKPKQSN